MQLSSSQTARYHRLKLVVQISLGILFLKILLGIVYQYRWYFPADFNEAAFLIGREEYFYGLYATAFYVHILVGPPIILLAAFLMWSGQRNSFRQLHRWGARSLMVLVLAALVPSGLVMATRAFAGPIAGVGFALLAIFTAGAASATWYFARTRQFAKHQVWATRTFLLLFSPLFLRLVSGVLIVLQWESTTAYCLNAWGSWLVPLMVYEFWRLRQRGADGEERLSRGAIDRKRSAWGAKDSAAGVVAWAARLRLNKDD